MSEQDDDLELEALQRQLDDAFSTVRPPSEFADDLWLRMQAKRPLWEKVGDAWSALWTGLREAPAVPAAAVAVVLVVAVGAALVTLNGRNGLQQTASQQSTAQSAGGAKTSLSAASGPFGSLPRPALQASGARLSYDSFTNPTTTTPTAPANDLHIAPAGNYYFGPANLSWSGSLPAAMSTAPVYRYTEPGSSELAAFATGLGATPTSGTGGRELRGTGFTLILNASTVSPVQEAFYLVAPDAGPSPTVANPEGLANALLSSLSLLPNWSYTVAVDAAGGITKVHFLRKFQLGGRGAAFLVDSLGDRYGLEVDERDGRVLSAAGPIPVKLETADYPIISGAAAVRAALSSSSANSVNPAVKLTSVELVYALAVTSGQSFYEPCYLFSGTFQLKGVTYVKRVLISAIAS